MTSEFLHLAPDTCSLVELIDSVNGLGYPIAEGVDSAVYLSPCRKKVVKIYKQFALGGKKIDMERLQLYKRITNAASDLMHREEWSILGRKQEVPVCIVPIDLLFYSNAWSKIVSISEFIEGSNLNQMALEKRDNDADALFTSVSSSLYFFSQDLGQSLGVDGINIGTLNTKLIKSESGGWRVVITDLCNRICELKDNKA